MELSPDFLGRERDITDLVTSTFTASEGAVEGELVGGLARNLLDTTPAQDLFVFSASQGATLIGCIFFSRMSFDQDSRTVFILSPVAVKPDMQGKGVGQSLLTYGLAQLRAKGIHVAVTYGDPKFYSKVGFQQMTEDFAHPPFKLTYPNGWLGVSLTDQSLEALVGPSHCVAALNAPALW